jgi:hypothetical protein
MSPPANESIKLVENLLKPDSRTDLKVTMILFGWLTAFAATGR